MRLRRPAGEEALRQPLPVFKLTAFAAVGLLALAYLLVSVIGTSSLAGQYHLTVQMPVTGGLFPGSQVTYRGVPIGIVTGIDITESGVDADLAIHDGIKLPVATRAVVADRSPAGEQYLDFQPTGSGAPYLQDGDVIPPQQTARPPSLGGLLESVQQFSKSINLRKLRGVFTQLDTALSGTGPALGRLIDHSAQIVRTLLRVEPQTLDLLRNGGRVLDTQAAHAGDLRTFATSLHQLAHTLRTDDPKTLRLINAALTTTRQLGPVLRQDAGNIGMLLVNLVTTGHIAVARIPGLKALLVSLSGAVTALDEGVHGDHVAFELMLATDPVCNYHTRYVPPWLPDKKPIRNGYCTKPAAKRQLQRGAAYAPRPPGDHTGRPPRDSGSATHHSAGANARSARTSPRSQADSSSWTTVLTAGMT